MSQGAQQVAMARSEASDLNRQASSRSAGSTSPSSPLTSPNRGFNYGLSVSPCVALESVARRAASPDQEVSLRDQIDARVAARMAYANRGGTADPLT